MADKRFVPPATGLTVEDYIKQSESTGAIPSFKIGPEGAFGGGQRLTDMPASQSTGGGGGIPTQQKPEKPVVDLSEVTSIEDYWKVATKKYRLDQNPYKRAAQVGADIMPAMAKKFSKGRYDNVAKMPKDMQQRFFGRWQKIFPMILKVTTSQYAVDEKMASINAEVAKAQIAGATAFVKEATRKQERAVDYQRAMEKEMRDFKKSFLLKATPSAATIQPPNKVREDYVNLFVSQDSKGRPAVRRPLPTEIQAFNVTAAYSGWQIGVDEKGQPMLQPIQRTQGIPTGGGQEQGGAPPEVIRRLRAGEPVVEYEGKKYRRNPQTNELEVGR